MQHNLVSSENGRHWLNERFLDCRRRNPSFSLRAFSRRLGISPATLSQILSGKRSFTSRTAISAVKRLCENDDVAQQTLGLLLELPQTTLQSNEPKALHPDLFRVISDWYYYPILSLSEVPGSRACPNWIARRLGISAAEAQAALIRLKRLGLIEIHKTRYRQRSETVAVHSETFDVGLRNHLFQNLKKAEESLDRDPIGKRDFSTITMSVNSKKLPEARRMIKKFRRQLSALLEDGEREIVYTLAIQLFPVDRGEPDKVRLQ